MILSLAYFNFHYNHYYEMSSFHSDSHCKAIRKQKESIPLIRKSKIMHSPLAYFNFQFYIFYDDFQSSLKLSS